MREFELVIDEAFKNGLSPGPVPFNTQSLQECVGFRCGRFGLEAYILDLELPYDLYYFLDPFYYQGVSGTKYGCSLWRESEIYLLHATVLKDGSHIEATFDIDESSTGVGTLMELADFGDYVLFTNGAVMIYHKMDTLTWECVTSSPKIPLMRTICNFKGQAVGGCVVNTWNNYNCDETFYIWSKIGEMDFNIDNSNEAGYCRCPFGGEVYHVRRLGDNVVGYSSKGITLLSPVTSPAPTFGLKEIHDIGLINRGAMSGNFWRQVYVNEDYDLMEITESGIKRLGYQHYMSQSEYGNDKVIVFYDSKDRDFYIQVGGYEGFEYWQFAKRLFLLSPNGLTEITLTMPEGEEDPLTIEPHICTEPFDMGYKGEKTIFSIETDVTGVTSPEVRVDWTRDFENWNEGHYVPLNNMGIASVIISANAFKFHLRFESVSESFKIGYMKIRYKMTDLRGLRGVYAPAPRGQA